MYKTLLLGHRKSERACLCSSWWSNMKSTRESVLSHSVVCESLRPHALYSPWDSPGQNTGAGSCSLLQGISPILGSNQVSHIPGWFFTSWATRETPVIKNKNYIGIKDYYSQKTSARDSDIHYISFVHSSAECSISCFHIQTIVNNDALSIAMHISLWISVFVFFGSTPEWTLTGSRGSPIFNVLRHLCAVFHSGCPSLHSPTVHIFVHHHSDLCWSMFLWHYHTDPITVTL